MLERLGAQFVEAEEPDLSVSDLIQEAWIRVWQGLRDFEGTDNEEEAAAVFYQWLRRTAWHVMLNIREARQAQRRRPPGHVVRLGDGDSTCPVVEASGKSPSGIAATSEDTCRVRKAVERIADPTDRAVIQLAFWDGLSLREIADILDQSYDSVRRRFHSALRGIELDVAHRNED